MRLPQWAKKYKYFIRNVRVYWQTLWRDRWYDSSYMMRLIQRKLEQDAFAYRKSGVAKDSEAIAAELLECATLAERFANWDEFYYDYDDLSKSIVQKHKEAEEAFAKDWLRFVELLHNFRAWSD